MTIDKVNYLNIGLMILSCLIAFVLPFELLLFSYVILGPLHYLTEISWLHKRQYFTPNRTDFRILVFLSFFILFPTLFRVIYHYMEGGSLSSLPSAQDLHYFMAVLIQFAKVMVFVVFAVAALLLIVENVYKRILGVAIIIVIGILIRREGLINVTFAIFVPTLIHVFVFTGAFILLGALKSRSRSGILSLVVFIGCAVSLFVFNTNADNNTNGDLLVAYSSGFFKLNRQIFATFLHIDNPNSNDLYYSKAGILITRFIAYAYTYHYLNWFSKTSVIKWHEVSKSTIRTIIIIWIAALILYFTSYHSGFAVLYFLSMLHVILEFPLNFQSFRDIGVEIKKIVLGKTTPVPAYSEWEGDVDEGEEEEA